MAAYVTSDFSVLAVAENSHTAKPLLYKISGVWGNHEGSMLLWLLVLGIYSAAIALTRAGGASISARALGVQGLIAAAFLLFVLFTSNPFLRLDPPPFEGVGLNPILQDRGLAFHPPLLYLGYVGLSGVFSYAVAALLEARNDNAWAVAARPFALIAWTALTLGVALGSWWAYYTLGWGGFWFWDPVENASLMPWLVATALIHSIMVTAKTGAFKGWTLFLAIAAFSFSLIGTFIVRSGVLTSVHAFANDPARGVFILAILVAAIGGSLALFAWRAPQFSPGAPFEPISREAAILLNSLLRLVCQGQSLDDSGAELAHDLRRLIRERIAAGQSDEAIKLFLVERYGDFVLMKPPVEPDTYALWFGPALFLVVGTGAVAITIARARRRAAASETGKRDI